MILWEDKSPRVKAMLRNQDHVLMLQQIRKHWAWLFYAILFWMLGAGTMALILCE